MPEIAEYTYEKEHLTEGEAFELYQHEKAIHPNAIIILEPFNCGHWEVETYKTESEKQTFYHFYFSKLVKNLLSRFAK